MHRNECIGFLSGWKIQNKSGKDIIFIHEAFPCQAANFCDHDTNNIDYSKNVEMEPESAQRNVEMIKKKGQVLLGWYHSHPKFEVNPSHIDVVNHDMYQKMFDEEGKQFFGLIISPYHTSNDLPPGLNAMPQVRCFINFKERENDKVVPYEVTINITCQARLHQSKLLKIIRELKENTMATDKINLPKESTQIKKKTGKQIILKKGDKLTRSIR